MELIQKYFPGLTLQQVEQFESLGALYGDWNAKINVISRKDMDNFYERHVLHSLSIARQFSFPDNTHILDLGSGGGFPGIPLAIFFPNVHFHMVDSIRKKLFVVENISNSIGLKNTTTQHTRAEEIKNNKFDMVISRAVAPLKQLWNWSCPLLAVTKNKPAALHGLICLKGGDLTTEIGESGCKPQIWKIHHFFKEDFFKDKSMLFIEATS
ncbi:MAG: 16S rRNA (guanine(527)-N(7))-methyltransferase RsmG [Ginsengibacter sp.]